MVGWQTQGWDALQRLLEGTGQLPQGAVDFVFELADYALDHQQEARGYFIAELDPDGPSFHTGFLTEGVAAAWALALRLHDQGRARAYQESCLAALRFLNQLILRPEDTFMSAQPQRAVGGVRGALPRSDVRVDYVSHVLVAMAAIQENLEEDL